MTRNAKCQKQRAKEVKETELLKCDLCGNPIKTIPYFVMNENNRIQKGLSHCGCAFETNDYN